MESEPIIIEDLVKFGEDRGFKQGATQERLRICETRFSRRLHRPLARREREMLAQRISTMTVERLVELFDASPSALEAWLSDPSAK